MRSPRLVLTDIGKGAGVGIALALFLVSVGLLRAAVYLVGGGKIQPLGAADRQTLFFYISGFAAAGALLGAARPLLRTKAGVYAGCMAAGVIVAFAVVLSSRRYLAAMGAEDWWFIAGLGALLGGAGAHGWFRSER